MFKEEIIYQNVPLGGPAENASWGGAVQDLTELTALTGNAIWDKQQRFVEDEEAIYQNN